MSATSQTHKRKRLCGSDEHESEQSTKRTWSYDPSQPPAKQTSQYFSAIPAIEDEHRKRRLEAKKKMLIADNNPFLKRQSSIQSDREPTPTATEYNDCDSAEESDPEISSLIAFFKSEQQKAKVSARRGKQKLTDHDSHTAGELQAIQLKKEHPGVILMFEVGYKCLFFGDDAEVASRELGIKYSTERKLPSAMVPMLRRGVYLKNLLSRGYKVGLVEQMETRALKKAGANRNTPFKRAVNHIYTAATYVDDLNSADNDTTPTLMCIVEEQKFRRGINEKVIIGLVIVCPTTGEVVWDHFEDTRMRTELETRIVHTRPYELLLPETGLSRESSRLLNYFVDHPDTEIKIRVENFSDMFSYSEALAHISKLYSNSRNCINGSDIMALVTDFPKGVVIALAHTIQHLSAFNISNAFRQAIHFAKLTNKMHMLLNANTLTNLEIYRNESDYTKTGSLLWILDRTQTRFGSRRLRSWLGRPLLHISALQERLDAVEELREKHDMNSTAKKLGEMLAGLPDLEKGLCRIQYGTCTPKELCDVLEAFHRVANTFGTFSTREEVGCRSKLLNEIVYALPKLQQQVHTISSQIKFGAAKVGEKHRMWHSTSKYHERIEECDEAVHFIEWELQYELKQISEYIGDPTLEFTTVALEEYLIQLPKNKIEDGSIVIPENWILISSTKQYKRYRTDRVAKLMDDRARSKELLEAEASNAFRSFLEDITVEYYVLLRDAVDKLASADCLRSLAVVAGNIDYVRPQFTEVDMIDIKKGRHPMVEVLRLDPFIPNDICLGGNRDTRCKIITGPNMGGKSSATKMVAIIAVMAQIGSFVPAKAVTMGVLDGIMTRMGASDELARGRSTFMVEMTETNEILQGGTSRSLVILDELGRGTSTFDGMAIADAVLRHLVEDINCKTLFVTHYPIIAAELERQYPAQVENLHMGYRQETRIDGSRDITFLYQLTRGVTTESFGVECGRLAGLPESILQVAASKSQGLRSSVESRAKRKRLEKCVKLLQECVRGGNEITLRELKAAIAVARPTD